MKFSIYISTINIHQLNSLNKFISINKDNEFIIYGNLNGNSFSFNNVKLFKSKEEFCKLSVTSDVLIFSHNSPFLNDESIINGFLSAKIKPIYYLDNAGIINDKINSNNKADLLFIFPGSILPLNLGSHQRSFNLIYQLKKIGICVDLLITGPKNIDSEKLKKTLSFFTNNVYMYENKKTDFSKIILAKRFTEKKLKKVYNKSIELPDLFSERLITKPNNSCKNWVNSLYINNSYKHIIVSYAWMIPCIDYIKHERASFDLICDTHDVQFIRNKVIFQQKERLLVNESTEKNLEINILNSCNSVLAISQADTKFLKESLNSQVNILEASSGFDYALQSIKSRPLRQPFRFGFIGGKMDANVKSLEFIIDQWWPTIKKFSPESKLYIAGSICNHPHIFNKIFLEENIIRLGFVDSLVDFYNSIDIALNPVLIQGGLNFKSVEAVFSGKHLATNPLGMECLGENFPAIVIKQPKDLISYLSNIEFDYTLDKNIRKSNQEKAKKLFGNNKLSTTLSKKLFNYL